MSHTYEIWDGKSNVNELTEEQLRVEFPQHLGNLYFIKNNDNELVQIQSEDNYPYKSEGLTFEESAQRCIEELDLIETAQQKRESSIAEPLEKPSSKPRNQN